MTHKAEVGGRSTVTESMRTGEGRQRNAEHRVGVGVSYSVGKMSSARELFLPVEATLPDGPFGRNSYSPLGREITTNFNIDSSDWTFNAGLLWHLSTTRFDSE